MSFEISLFDKFTGKEGNSLIQKQAVNEIIKYNELTEQFGLVLTEKQAAELILTRNTALLDNGRVEFGSGVIGRLIYEFCDSPFISKESYEQTLHELIELFYYYKNETLDLISDEELIKFMKKSFDGVCQGSLELLSGRELYNLAHSLRFGGDKSGGEEKTTEEEEEEEGDWDGEY